MTSHLSKAAARAAESLSLIRSMWKSWGRTLVALGIGCALLQPAHAGPAGPLTWTGTATVKSGNASWGRMTKLSNGDWLAVYTVFPSGAPTRLEIARSTNSARTWSHVTTVSESGRKLDNGELLQLPNGVILLAMRSVVDGQSYRLVVYRSTDGGASWSSLSTIDSNENPGGLTNRGLWEPTFNILPDGSLSVFYANEKYAGGSPYHSQVISQRISTDDGATWGSESWAVSEPGGGNARPGMAVMARMPNGKFIMVFEVCGFGPCDVAYHISDDGVTWPNGLGTRIRYQRCAPFIVSTTDGRLAMTSCQNEVSYSNDYGATWLKNDPAAWPMGFTFSWPAIYQTAANELAVMAITAGGAVQLKFGALAPALNNSNNLSDNFADGNDAGWSRYGANFSVSGGRYRVNNAPGSGNASSKALTGDETWTSGTLEADVLLSSSNNAGLMFRTINGGFGADEAFGYYVGLDAAADAVTLGKQANNWTTIASAVTPLSLNTWYRVKVTFNGSAIAVYVGDMLTPKITAIDSAFTRGQIGLRSHFANAQFDNVVFTRSTFVDDFQDGNDAGWTRHGGAFATTGGVYTLNNASGSGKSAWSTPAGDFTFELDVRIAAGGGDAGAIFRASSIGVGYDAMNGYYAGLNESGDVLVLGRMNGAWTELATASVAVAPNTWYHLKIVAMGSDIRVYVTDMNTPKIHVTDSAWPSGAVGVRAHFTDASFDQIAVTK